MFVCECGGEEFQTFFKYKSADIERFRCNKCEKMYEREGDIYAEYNVKSMTGKEKFEQLKKRLARIRERE